MEVEGEVFNMLSLDEQDARLEAYARVLNGLPEQWLLQGTMCVEPTDIAGYIHGLVPIHLVSACQHCENQVYGRPVPRLQTADSYSLLDRTLWVDSLRASNRARWRTARYRQQAVLDPSPPLGDGHFDTALAQSRSNLPGGHEHVLSQVPMVSCRPSRKQSAHMRTCSSGCR